MSENKINIDFHTHILPGIDDGATDVKVSERQLHTLKEQGVDAAFLTSHFDFRNESRERFLSYREEAYEKLLEIYDESSMPKIYKGAEIYMTRGMEKADFSGLELEKTGYLLIEFPREPFGAWMFDIIETLIFERKKKVMIAHVNRVISSYKKDVVKNLFEYPDLVFQVNCEAFHGLFAADPFKNFNVDGLQFVLGTDTHDMGTRAPDFDKALHKLNGRGLSYLREAVEKTTGYFKEKINV